MKKFVKILLCIAMCFSVLAAMGVAVSADNTHPSNPGFSVATQHFVGGYEYSVSVVMSMSQNWTSYDLHWGGVYTGSDDTGGSNYGEIGFNGAVYGAPASEVDWSWMSTYHGNGAQDWYYPTIY